MKIRSKITVPVWLLVLLLISSTVSFVVAVTITVLTPEKISLFAGQVTDSDFVIDGISTDFLSANRIRIRLTIRNTDTGIHSANVTVTLLDSDGDVIDIGGDDLVQSQLTGDISGSGTINLVFNFQASGLVSQYQSNFIEIHQLV